MNDLRPVALTSAAMNVFERVVLIHFQVLVTDFLDPWQFAYRRNRSVENAVLRVFNSIYAHLDKPGTYIRLMFFDFSSAFSTIQPNLLAEKLLKMKISAPTILWVLDYLTSRPQYVKLGPSVPTQEHLRGLCFVPFFSLCIQQIVKMSTKRAQQQSLPMTMDLLDKQQMMTAPVTDKR